jgi:DNA-binding NarL/FixJ family response regulator
MDSSRTADAVRVMLVAHHPALRQSLREIVDREADLEVAAEARDIEEAVTAVRALEPDAVVLDVALAMEDGIAALRRGRPGKRPPRIIMVSISADREHVVHALRAGACGYLRTQDAAEELVAALRSARPERPFLGAAVDREGVMSEMLQVGGRPTLLVVQDDPELAEATKAALESADYRVLVADSERDGLDLVRSARPDGIILDVEMPAGTAGFHFIWELRKDADRQVRNIPILVVTSMNGPLPPQLSLEPNGRTRDLFEYFPVQDFVDRALSSEQLIEKVQSLLPARARN